MAVTIQQVVNTGPNSWLVRWSSDQADPVFAVYRNGAFVRYTRGVSEVFTIPGGNETLIVQVLDDAALQAIAAETTAELTWPAVAGARAYRVEENVDAAWVLRATIADEGLAEHKFRTGPLTDLATHNFRVTSIGANDNESSPVATSVSIPRNPDPPEVAYSFDNGTKVVTIAAA